MNMPIMESSFLVQGSPGTGLEIVRADDCFVYDGQGREYIDFVMGWCVGNLGWNNRDISDAIRDFDGPAYVYPGYLYQPWEELAELLVGFAPKRLKKCIRATGGTEAVDIALQAAALHTGRSNFISIEGSYHGNSLATRCIASSDNEDPYKATLPCCHRIAPPLDDAALEKIEKLLAKKGIAAFIMEPVICNLGVLIPQAQFMTRLESLCRKYGTLLIMDEVATGFGRTGRIFACEHFNIEPDIMCLAKAITGGYAPMGATLVTEEIAASLKDVSFWSTYGWHPLSVAAALANIGALSKNKESLLENVEDTSDFIFRRLRDMPFGNQAIINIKGLAVGVDVQDEEYAKKIKSQCQDDGLLITQQDSSIVLFPALNVSRQTVSDGLDILEGACR